jgi:hypothetical protein
MDRNASVHSTTEIPLINIHIGTTLTFNLRNHQRYGYRKNIYIHTAVSIFHIPIITVLIVEVFFS